MANDETNDLGFYFQGVNGDGSSVSGLAGKAYLQVETVAGLAPVNGFRIDGNEITGIKTVEGTLENTVIYTMAGVRVNVPGSYLPRGPYIINGKKYW